MKILKMFYSEDIKNNDQDSITEQVNITLIKIASLNPEKKAYYNCNDYDYEETPIVFSKSEEEEEREEEKEEEEEGEGEGEEGNNNDLIKKANELRESRYNLGEENLSFVDMIKKEAKKEQLFFNKSNNTYSLLVSSEEKLKRSGNIITIPNNIDNSKTIVGLKIRQVGKEIKASINPSVLNKNLELDEKIVIKVFGYKTLFQVKKMNKKNAILSVIGKTEEYKNQVVEGFDSIKKCKTLVYQADGTIKYV